MGVATFVIDSFSARGLTAVSTNQALLGRFNMTLDTFRAWDTLAAHPRVDAGRIAVMGFSRGGSAVIYSTLRRFQKQWSPAFKVVATFPMYPSCFDHIDGDEDVAGPIREYHGDKDDYASTEQCKAWIARLKAAGKDATSTEYRDAAHSFDSPTGVPAPATSVNKNSQSQRNCHVSEHAGALVNDGTGKPFAYIDACVTFDPHSNYSADATQRTRAEVGALLREKMGLAAK
jgi:dienelactone hydrolase